MNRIEKHFAQTAQMGRKSLVMFLTAGFPDLQTTERLIPAIEQGGCDVLELGVPFSDPIADGPTIQAASTAALKAGTTLQKILSLVERVRERSEMPIVLFGAYNPFLHYGLDALCERAAAIGVDGFLVPDLPIEESDEFEERCRRAGLSMVYLVAPTTPPERMGAIAERGSGFLYYISLKGVTGAAIDISPQLREHVGTLRAMSRLPVAIGFGVKTPEHVALVGEVSDAVVVGSALINLIDRYKDSGDLAEQVSDYVRSLKAALA
ncbi:MAG: tryptophan synthase subunit alpha [Alphaproteobacteria bacterium]